MKLWKKILIGVIVLAVIGMGAIIYGFFKIGQTYTEKVAPDMMRYVQMTQTEQDQYVLSKMSDFTEKLYGEEKEGKGKAVMEAMNKDPELRQAGLLWGRSLCASIIKEDKDIFNTLSPQNKKKYEEEADDMEERSERFQALMKKMQ